MPIIELFGVIGWGVSLDSFSWRLRQLRGENPNDTIIVKINSPGGYPRDGWGIAHLIENDGNIDTMNVGLAASVAGFILQKGRRRLSASSSMTMMHRTQLDISGDCDELERVTAMLKEWDAEIIKVIQARTNIKDEAEINKLLQAPGWWQNSDNALASGLIDEIVTTEQKQPLPQNSIEFVTKNYSALSYNVLNQIIAIPQNIEKPMTPEQIQALADGIKNAVIEANKPLVEAVNKLIEVETSEPAEPSEAENATKAIVSAAIEPALNALTASSDALKNVVEALANTPAPTNHAPSIYGSAGGQSADVKMV